MSVAGNTTFRKLALWVKTPFGALAPERPSVSIWPKFRTSWAVQELNAAVLIVVRLGKSITIGPLPKNADVPIDVTLLPPSIVSNAGQPLNALLSIVVSVSGNFT